MKVLFFIIAFCLTSIASALEQDINTANNENPDSIESRLQNLEKAIIHFESAISHFENGMEEQESNPKMKSMFCIAYRTTITRLLANLRAFSADLKKMSNQMSESQLIRFSSAENMLSKSSPEHPLCVGT
jgi:hypothetical protein